MHVRGRVHPGLSQARGPRRGNPAVQTDRHHRAVQIFLDAPRCEMSDTRPSARYTEYHPRWYRTRVSTWWWLARWPYLKFILREISSVFVAWFVVVLLLQIRALSHGPHAYARFEHWLQNPGIVLLNLIALFFVVFHAITWFNLTPRAMVVRLRGKRAPDRWIVSANYTAWAAVSLVVAWFLVRSYMVKHSNEPVLWSLFSAGGVF